MIIYKFIQLLLIFGELSNSFDLINHQRTLYPPLILSVAIAPPIKYLYVFGTTAAKRLRPHKVSALAFSRRIFGINTFVEHSPNRDS